MVSIRERVKRIFTRKKKEPTPKPKQSIPTRDFGDPSQQTPRPGSGLPQQTSIPTPGADKPRRRGGGGRSTPQPTIAPKKIIKPKPKFGARVSISQQQQLLRQKQQRLIQRRLRSSETIKRKLKDIKIPIKVLKKGLERERKRKKEARKKVGSRFRTTADVVSGGFFTNRKISQDQGKLNKEVEDFNKKFGGKELTQDQFKKASESQSKLKQDQTNLKKRQDKLDSSGRKKFGQLIFGLKGTEIRSMTEAEREKNLQDNKQVLKSVNTQLKNKDLSGINKIRLNTIKKNAKFRISNLESGKDVKTGVIADTILFGPSGIPGVASKLKVVFVGRQTTKGGKITTTVALKSNKGIEGFAKGVTTKSGKTSVTITKGRFGTRAIKFPTAKTKIVRKKTFVAVERAISKKDVFALRRTTDLLKRSKKNIKITQTNIKGLVQAGKGRVVVGRGQKLVKTTLRIPSGKLLTKKKRGLQIDDFASLSAIISRKDLSLIIGKTITSKGDKAKFIGLIKGSGKLGKGKDGGLSTIQQQQFKKALRTVLSSATSAVAKADKTKGLTQAQKLALASTTITPPSKKVSPKKPTKPSLKRVTRPRFKGVPVSTLAGRGPQLEFQPTLETASAKLNVLSKQLGKREISVKQKKVIKGKQNQVMKQLSNQLNNQRQRFIQKAKSRQRQLAKQLQNSRLGQRQRQLLRQRSQLLQRQVTKLKMVRITARVSIPKLVRTLKPIPIPLRKKSLQKRKKGITEKQAYDVKARPRRMKGKKIPKLIKVNKVPLSKRDAKNIRNKVLDESLARTGRIIKTKGKPQKPKLLVKGNFAKKTKGKFRTHRIVKGKRVPLPKGKVIERSKYLLDTVSEKKQITLRKKIVELERLRERKRRVQGKRRVSQKTLDALERGRKKRLQNLKRRRR